MALQKAIALAGVAIQAAVGTPAANPSFVHGVSDGSIFTMDLQQDRAPVTTSQRTAPYVDRTGALAGFSFTTRPPARSVGAWLYAALGGKSVTGAGPYTHTLSQALALPSLTVFAKLDDKVMAVQDAKVGQLAFSWGDDGILSMQVEGMGTLVNYAATFAGSPVDDTFLQPLSANGGVLKFAASGASPAVAPVKAGSVTINNNLDAVKLSSSVMVGLIKEGRQDIDLALTLVPAALDEWRTMATGSSGGTAASEAPVYGSADLKVVVGSDSLQLVANRVAFAAGFPAADPQGGAAEIELAGTAVLTTAGAAAITGTLLNTQATYTAV